MWRFAAAILLALCIFGCKRTAPFAESLGESGDGGERPNDGAPDSGESDAGSAAPAPGNPASQAYLRNRPANYVNPIPAENELAADPTWSAIQADGDNPRRTAHVEGYADRVSASAGDSVQVMVNADDGAHEAAWTLCRLGWYGGAGARKVAQGTASMGKQPACFRDKVATGLVRCSWKPTFSVQIPPGSVSGLYLFKMVRDDGWGAFIPWW